MPFSTNDSPINGYRLVEPVGSGPFGEVWKAVRTRTQVLVALKLIDLNAHPEFIRAIPRLKQIRTLEHPRMLTIFTARLLDRNGREYRLDDMDRAVAGLRWLVVASWLGEMSLAEKLRRDRAKAGGSDWSQGLPVDELLDYMESAAEGLDFMNRPPLSIREDQGPFVHGDVKPSNLILLSGSVQLADNYQLNAVPTSSNPGTTNWSNAYTPSELTEGRPGPGTDQYSLAITYYELRTGKLPFPEGYTSQGIAMRHAAGTLEFSSLLLTESERQVLRWATSVRASDRYSSCSEFVRQLAAAARNQHVLMPNGNTYGMEASKPSGQGHWDEPEPETRDIGEQIRKMGIILKQDPTPDGGSPTLDFPFKNSVSPALVIPAPVVPTPVVPNPVVVAPVTASAPSPVISAVVTDSETITPQLIAPGTVVPFLSPKSDSESPLVVIIEPQKPDLRDLVDIRATRTQTPDELFSPHELRPPLEVSTASYMMPDAARDMPQDHTYIQDPMQGPLRGSTDLIPGLAREPILPHPSQAVTVPPPVPIPAPIVNKTVPVVPPAITPLPVNAVTPNRAPVDARDPASKHAIHEFGSSLAELLRVSGNEVSPPPQLEAVTQELPMPVFPPPQRSGPIAPVNRQKIPPATPPEPRAPKREPEPDSKPSWYRVAELARQAQLKAEQEARNRRPEERRPTRIPSVPPTEGSDPELDLEPAPAAPAPKSRPLAKPPKSAPLGQQRPQPLVAQELEPSPTRLEEVGSSWLGSMWGSLRQMFIRPKSSASLGGDDVECSLFMPRRVQAGQTSLFQIYIHEPDHQPDGDAKLVYELAQLCGKQALIHLLPQNARLDVEVVMEGIFETNKPAVWRGRPSQLQISFAVPPDAATGSVPGRVVIRHEGEEIASIEFLFAITPSTDPGVPTNPRTRRNPGSGPAPRPGRS